MFTFGVVSYNHESFILEILESIKYQIIKYFDKEEIQLIISDDSSQDKTIQYAKAWCEINSSLFTSVDIIESDENLGTCKNIVKIYKAIKGDRYICISADDLISYHSIQEYVSNLNNIDDMIHGSLLVFSTDHVLVDFKHYKNRLLRGENKRWMMDWLSIITVPIDGPSMSFRKELLDNGLIEFISQFDLIEDRPTIYYLLRHYDLNISYINKPHFMYRLSLDSVSRSEKGSSISNRVFNSLRKFFQYVYLNEKGMKKMVAYSLFMYYSGHKMYKLLNVAAILYRFYRLSCVKKIRLAYETLMNSETQLCQQHLTDIIANAKKAKKEIELIVDNGTDIL